MMDDGYPPMGNGRGRLPPMHGAPQPSPTGRGDVDLYQSLPRPDSRGGALPPLNAFGQGQGQGQGQPGGDGYTNEEEQEMRDNSIFTGLDVVEYYAAYGHDARVKVFHCNPAPTENGDYSPYDLEVVPRHLVGPEHYTLSASGVVYVRGDGAPPEFMPIGEWLRELSIYNLMRGMRFFKSYLPSKMFRLWRDAAHARRFARVRERIAGRLFLAKPNFCTALMDVRGAVSAWDKAPFVDVDPEKPYRLIDFATAQQNHRASRVVPQYEVTMRNIEASLKGLITEVQHAEQFLRAEIDEILADPSHGASRGLSTVKTKTEKLAKQKAHRVVSQEVALLPSLVRLVDYMLVETSVAHLRETVDEIRAVFGERAVFITEVSFSATSLDFAPHAELVTKAVRKEIGEGLIDMVKGMPRVLHAEAFAKLFAGGPRGGPDVTSILVGNKALSKGRVAVDQAVAASFKQAGLFAAKYDDLRDIHTFSKTFNPQEYKAASRDVAQFRKDMMLLREWLSEVDAAPNGQRVGLLHLDCTQMQEQLSAVVHRALEVLRTQLTVAAHKQCKDMLEFFNGLRINLDERPYKLDDFCAFYQRFLEYQEKEEGHKGDYGTVSEMYDMLVEYGGKIPPNDQVNLDDLKEVYGSYAKSMTKAGEFIDERKASMVTSLHKATKELLSGITDLLKDCRSGRYDNGQDDPALKVNELAELNARFTQLQEDRTRLLQYEEMFELNATDFGEIEVASKELGFHTNKWTYLHEFRTDTDGWMGGACADLDPQVIESKVQEKQTLNYKMLKQHKDDLVVQRLKGHIEEFKEAMPMLQECANPALEPRHWEVIFGIVDQKYSEDKPFCMRDLLGWGIAEKYDDVQTVAATASKEYSMLKTMEKMEAEWEGLEFKCIGYKDTGTHIVGGTDEVQTILDDQIVKIQAMNTSPFVKPFKERASEWEKMLMTLQDMLDNWLQCQSTWLYLEPIFSSDDIVKQMPEEGNKFRQVDGMWRAMMAKTVEAPLVVPIARERERLDNLLECNELLEAIQKGLAAYLEKKRLFFPRFFFLSNDEMLEILSETKDPTRVQPHLKKCFEGIDKLEFTEDNVILAMNSIEKESVPLKQPIDTNRARGAVEKWLVEVEAAMFESVHHVTSLGIEDYAARERHDWVLQHPGMVVLVVTAIFWTKGVQDALREGGCGAKAYEEKCTADLMKIVDLVRGELSKLQRATLGALVVMDVHARDVVANLAANNITSEKDFEWQAQLRSSWEIDESGEKDNTVIMCMMSARLEYGFEYLGNSSRLVITPLTDRCYRTLMGALHLTLGGAPEGPAGTGKTETTKDLAKALARQCVVFNCSDSLDYIAMGKFFKGLASSGAWACFDEFNRIDLEVLSVVAQQVLEIQRAIGQRKRKFTFEGTEMQLRWSAWCSITMNPGYAGRSELPDNLKALFRTVAMMVPDYAMIAEIILFSFGYLKARESSKKIVQCYKLCSEQLSSQDHYDYGMRAVIAVLRAAGNLKRRFPEEDEFVLMLRSIIDVNLCKFLSHDVPLFQGIISDLFPGVVLPKSDYTDMEAAMHTVCETLNLQPTDYFFLKTIQLYEMIVVRHGLMIVGEPFSGKTKSYNVLAKALTLMNERGQDGQEKVEFHVINPKSITMGQLYGQFDPVSHEWTDGILAVTFRACAANPSPDRKWLLLDGPVDAIWIENMNTVLDDNKKLCLNSGEIIQMSPPMSMIFEVMDLAVASPATVSRCGMVYLEPHQLGWRPIMLSWINTLPEHMAAAEKEHLKAVFDWLVPVSLRFLRRDVKEASPTSDSNAVIALMRTFDAMAKPTLSDADAYAKLTDVRALLESVWMFSFVWSIGCTGASNADRQHMDEFFRHAAACTLPDYTSPSGERYTEDTDIPEGHVTFSAPMIPNDKKATIYDYVYDVESMKWKLWTSMIDDSPIPSDMQVRNIIVPTQDTVRYTYLLDLAVQHNFPALFVGPTGTGKSVYIAKYLYHLDPEAFAPPIVVGFSARTSANVCQYMIDAKLDRRRKGVFGPAAGKKVVIFVDDLNMPTKETYGAQPPIELLRQYMDHGGWYARDNTNRLMVDCQFVAAMGPPGGGRTFVTPRYTRHFNCVSVTEFDTAGLVKIFSTILDWSFKRGGEFPTPVRDARDSIVAATLDVYATAMAQLLPTPTRSHYTFNLRDISRVMQGLLMLAPEQVGTGAAGKDKYLRCWMHEVVRVFYDRLVDKDDRGWLLDYLKQTAKKHFGVEFDSLFRHLVPDGGTEVGVEDLRQLFFGDYMDEAAEEPSGRKYDEVQDVAGIVARMEEFLIDHNAMSKQPMNLAMFLYAVEHISRLARIFRQPGSHMLNAGVGGSGRQSLSKLAAFATGMEPFQIEVSKSYGKAEWREDLKKFTRVSGAQAKPAVFIFSDTQIKEESFVEDINNLLNAGEVPNMFPYDERAAVLEDCRVQSKKEGNELENPADLWNYFVDKTKANLHIVLCFSPVGDAFRERLRQFPSLVNCCTINWFTSWPKDALEAVAMKFLKEIDVPQRQRIDIMEMCKMFHEDVRHISLDFKKQLGRINYVTPTSYLELITMFDSLLKARRAKVSAAKKRYEVGLDKLQSTATQVAEMQEELVALQPNLEKTVKETEALLASVSKEKTEVVEPKKKIVDAEVAKAEEAAAAANAIKTECEAALAEAMPILNAALSALDTIKPADIKLVQSFKNPPATIKLVMEAVCVILEVKPARVKAPDGVGMVQDYWEPSKKLLSDPNFISRMKTYDKDNIPVKVIETIRNKYRTNPDFTPENAAKASSAAEGMCRWVCAMDSYDKVAKVVAPKRESLAVAEGQYNEVMVQLNAKQADLKEVMDKLAAAEKQLEESTNKKNELEAEVELCKQKLERAEKLIGGLGGEKTRWTESARQLGIQYDNLTGDMLIAAGMISYLGAFTIAFRERALDKWVAAAKGHAIPTSARFSLVAVLGDQVKIRAWGISGLPNDNFSIDNAIMVDTSRRWPLMIDPQSQANKWVKNMEKDKDIRVIKLTDGDYLRILENAIQFGLPVLLENVGEELDPSLEPLLLKQIFKQGGVDYIRMGENVIEFSEDFRFYITTALRNPHYLPETAVKVTLLNFMITQDGLSDQLLGVVVAEERPDLESQRQALVVESAENKRALQEIEDKILHVLSSSEGNILEDQTAIDILSDAKVLADQIGEKEKVAEKTQEEIDAARTSYAPAGAYNAVLFFCIRDMAAIDPMYQYSLSWFAGLFVRSIRGSEKDDDLEKRLHLINEHFTYSLYQNVCRSLFEKDKLLFAFLLGTRIASSRGDLSDAELSFLLTGGVGIPEKEVANPAAEWISAKAWGEVCRIHNVAPPLEGLCGDMAASPGEWRPIFDAVEPQGATLPGGYDAKLAAFEKLLVLRALRPDKLVPAIQGYVSASMGQRFIEPPPFDLAGSYAESSVTAPLLFVLSPGSDPTGALLKFADDRGYGSKISFISMGQGQGPKAAALIAEATKNGTWVLLQNCHLAASWMPALEKICEGIRADNTDADFRLWMTSLPSPAFPVSILQNAVKMTNEPPAGLRANLKRSYGLDPIAAPEFFEACTKPAAFKAMLFGLTFIHAFVQERRKFGPIGWNIPYGFDDGDLRISVRQLQMYLDDNNEVPFAALKYAIGECNYGGRVTDDKDRRLLMTILDRTYRDEILEPQFVLSASGTYVVPPEGDHDSYVAYINSLPILPLPEAFGLHDNADITKDLQETHVLLETLIKTSGGGGEGGSGSKDEELVAHMTKDILARLPPQFDIEKAQHKYPVLYEESMNQVLCQEMLRYNRLTAIIRNSLVNLEKALAGLQVMSTELDQVFRSMAIGGVPALWLGKSFPSLQPLASYVNDLLKRLNMFSTWYEVGQPVCFWLPGFFFTPSFTTAALQNYARGQKLAIDSVGYDFEMLGVDPAKYDTQPEHGIYVYGGFLEGCAWDAGAKMLKESKPKVLFDDAPVFWMRPMKMVDFPEYPHYACPVYRTPERKGVLATTGHSTNFLMFVKLPTDQPEYHWTMRGVCMLMSLSD